MNLNRSAFINFQQTDCRRKFDKLFSRNLSSFLLHLRKVPTSFKRGLQAQRPPLPIDFSQSGGADHAQLLALPHLRDYVPLICTNLN